MNEPNNPAAHIKSPVLYAELVAAASTAIWAAVPSALVVGPATENIDTAWLTALFEAGALSHFSQLTVHPYRSDSPEMAAVDLAALRVLGTASLSLSLPLPLCLPSTVCPQLFALN